MEIDPVKLAAKLSELGPGWIFADGLHALTKVQFENGPDPVFYPSSGIPIKVFMNTDTGEIRMFPIAIFKAEDHE